MARMDINRIICTWCVGNGWSYKTCPSCDGKGHDASIMFPFYRTCERCNGERRIKVSCNNCGGSGYTGHYINYDPGTDTKSSSSGCFIATAVYGSALTEEVAILRKFRDEIIIRSKLGRKFIMLYYKASPPIAKLIAEYDYIKLIIKKVVVAPAIFLAKKFIKASNAIR